MRHRLLDHKLGRSLSQRRALMSALSRALIEQKRIETSVDKAKAAKRVAERLVTVAKRGIAAGAPQDLLSAKRVALSTLHHWQHVRILFEEVAPACAARKGGYTRIVRLGRRTGDGAEVAILEWVDVAPRKREKKPAKKDAKEAASK